MGFRYNQWQCTGAPTQIQTYEFTEIPPINADISRQAK